MAHLPWLKLWVEMLDDEKMQLLTTEQWGIWIKLLLMAQKREHGGWIRKINGGGYSDEEWVSMLGVGIETWHTTCKLMAGKRMNMIRFNKRSGTLFVINLSKRQARKPSDEPEKTKERQKSSRRRHADSHADVTPLEERGKRKEYPPTPHNIFTLYERYIGTVVPYTKIEEVKQLEYEYCPKWIEDAFKDAADKDKRSLGFVKWILERWGKEGFPGEEVAVEAAKVERW